jgi:hypothetical protein
MDACSNIIKNQEYKTSPPNVLIIYIYRVHAHVFAGFCGKKEIILKGISFLVY